VTPVVVTFRRELTAAELAALGLAGEGRTGFGVVDDAALARLRRHPDVERVDVPPSAKPALPPSLGPRLAAALDDGQTGPFDVVVTFAARPADAPPGLAVAGTTAHGRVDRETALALAARPDVVQVEATPPHKLRS
jgi:hypothetical protein